MVGMIQIVTWLLCVYLVYKGYELFQMALLSTRPGGSRVGALITSTGLLIVSVIAAILFYIMINAQAEAIGSNGNNFGL